MLNKMIYLDYAASTPIHPKVYILMKSLLKENYANPSSLHSLGRKAKAILEEARKKTANVIGAKSNEIIFTSGATESINLAIQGVAKVFCGTEIISTNIEHEVTVKTLQALAKQKYKIINIKVNNRGLINPDKIFNAINPKTVLVNIIYANSEVGTIQSIAKIGQIVNDVRIKRKQRSINLPIYFHIDAAQACTLDIHVNRLGVDMMSLDGSKIYGPKGSGCLYVRTGTIIDPIIYGGGQERGLRGGTENIAGCMGFATALELIQKTRLIENQRLQKLRDYLAKNIIENIPGSVLNGDPIKRLSSNLNITFSGVDAETLVMALDHYGVAVSVGSACNSGSTKPSHTLKALGLKLNEINSSIRFSLGKSTIKKDIDYIIKILPKAIKLTKKVLGL